MSINFEPPSIPPSSQPSGSPYAAPSFPEKVFSLITKMSQGSIKEVYIPYLLKEMHTREIKPEFVFSYTHIVDTQCGIAYEAMMTTLLGLDYEKTHTIKHTKPEWGFLESAIQHNAQIASRDHGQIFVYGMDLNTAVITQNLRTTIGGFPGHCFIVIQYANEKGEICYRFYQTNVGDYSLKQYIEKGPIELDHFEFQEFLKGLKKLTLETSWTKETEEFCQKYFKISNPMNIGGTLSPPLEFKIHWDVCNADSIKKAQQEMGYLPMPKIVIFPEKHTENLNLDPLQKVFDSESQNQDTITICMSSRYGMAVKKVDREAFLYAFEISGLNVMF